jgi:uncharacterized protein YdaU (DUF1376 family)
MAANNLYMPFHVGDYMTDAGHLTTLETGAYFLLICAYWQRGGPLPTDDRILQRIAKVTPDEWAAMRDLILPYFYAEGERLHHKRIDDELARAMQRTSAARANAERSHSSRKANAQQRQSHSKAQAEPNQSAQAANQEQDKEEAIASSTDDAKLSISEMKRRLEQATGWIGLPGEGVIADLVKEGVSFEDRILPLARDEAERRHEPPKSWTYLAAVVRDASRQPTARAKPVEQAWVPLDSPAWEALEKVKKKGLLRAMLRSDGRGGEGVYWPASEVVALMASAAA